ncbi:YCII-related domain protein [Anatilimnocola aggregata]|uniref:YCII-related domain protein n=1 Tax=Anatilimnocola aggregata TaxID=2528021 RepID=A0A517YE35_9BACT|nr:YciI family protein [Anatilimnocola aggregata]QDU28490.1 YCII-related domain protein [Anatilimnocola aggregata]
MQYICLIAAENMMEHFTAEEAARQYDEYQEITEQLRRSAQLVSCNRLKPPEDATTVRVRGGKAQVIDGPYAETKEQLGGYYVIEAKDLNEAIQIAARFPGARYGCVEVRPIAVDDQTRTALGF